MFEDHPVLVIEMAAGLPLGADDDNDVFLLGKRLRLPCVVFSHIKSDCKLPGQGGYTREHIFVGRRGQPFALPGDSAGFVLNTKAKLVGLLIGGPECGGYGYVTPFAEICTDVEARTGYALEL